MLFHRAFSLHGFHYAPITKTLIIVSATSSLVTNHIFPRVAAFLNFNEEKIIHEFQLWRLFTSFIAYDRTIDLIYGTVILYNFRIFERRYGTPKFLSYLIAVLSLSAVFQLALLLLFKHYGTPIQLPGGPYCWIYALLISYFQEIPRLQAALIRLSDKSLLYMLCFQLLTQSRGSVVVGWTGMLAGIIVRFKLDWFHRILRLPDSVHQFCHTWLGPLIYSSPPLPDSRENPMGATTEIQRRQYLDEVDAQLTHARMRQFGITDDNADVQRQRVGQGYQEVLLPPDEGQVRFRHHGDREDNLTRRPNQQRQPQLRNEDGRSSDISEENVKTLLEMGFSRIAVVQALRATNDDIGAATNILLDE